MNLSFLIPVHNERETVEPLVEGILNASTDHSVRILFIDDGSTDGTSDVLRALQARIPQLDFIRFRRNLGKSAALAAGFERAQGDIVFTMDGDLQDDPQEIPRFIEKLDEGFDVVVGWKSLRHDPWHKVFPSRFYNACVSYWFGLNLHDVNCGYKAFRLEVVKNIPMYGELHRLVPVLAADLGYRIAEIAVTHHPRRYGVSKYGLERFTRGASDVLSTYFVSRYRNVPGHFFARWGVGSMITGTAMIAGGGIAWAAWKYTFLGVFCGLIGAGLFSGGISLIGLGLVAELFVRSHRADSPSVCLGEERSHTTPEP